MEEIKERISTHISFIEVASEEFKVLNEEMVNLINELQKEDEEETYKLEIFKKYKSLFMYSTLLYKDIENAIFSFIESYTCAFISGVKFTDKEKELYDKYIESNGFNFIVDKNKLQPKTKDLMGVIKEKVEVNKDDLQKFMLNIKNFYNG
jgi:hypothetical protein